MNSEKSELLSSDTAELAAGKNSAERHPGKLAKSDELLVRIEPTFGELSELPANDVHGRAVERFQQAKLSLNSPDQVQVPSEKDRKSTRLNSSHSTLSRMPSSA